MPLHAFFNGAVGEVFCDAQERAKNVIFNVFQAQRKDWCTLFRGNGFIVETKSCIYLIGRDTCYGPTELRLIPSKTALSKKIVTTYHNLSHGSDISVRADIIKNGYYLPHALKHLAKHRRSCVVCKKLKMKYLHTKMGAIGERRLTPSAPVEYLQSDLKGPLYIQEHVNKRGTRKAWLLTNIDHFSRYVSVSVGEDLSTETIINAIMAQVFRFGCTKVIESDCRTD